MENNNLYMKGDGIRPTVSVIISTHNRARLVGRAIQSVLNQTYRDFVIVVVDDGSTDNTCDVVHDFDQSLIKCIRHEINLGGAAALNTGLRTAESEYVAILDDDDIWSDQDKLRKQIGFLDAHPGYVLVGTNRIAVDNNGGELNRSLFPERDEEIRSILLTQNCFAHSSVVYRRSVAMAVGGYDRVIGTHYSNYPNDYGLWLKLGTVGKLANLSIYGIKLTAWPINSRRDSRLSLCLKDIQLVSRYRKEYPNYQHAMIIRTVDCFRILALKVSEISPLRQVKRFFRNKSSIQI